MNPQPTPTQPATRQGSARRLLLVGAVSFTFLTLMALLVAFALPGPTDLERLACGLGDSATCRIIGQQTLDHWLALLGAFVSGCIAVAFAIAGILER